MHASIYETRQGFGEQVGVNLTKCFIGEYARYQLSSNDVAAPDFPLLRDTIPALRQAKRLRLFPAEHEHMSTEFRDDV
jgi:hypothetical protein